MHDFALQDRHVLHELADWIVDRRSTPTRILPTRTTPLPPVTPEGIGIDAAWAAIRDHLLPTSFATDHPRYLAFVGGSPTPAAIIADAAVSAASVYGGSELEAGDVVEAERIAMRWLCDVVGYPESAHGVFVSGGSMANLSALVAARHERSSADGGIPNVILASRSAHSSVRAAATIMGCRIIAVGQVDRPMTGTELTTVLDELDARDIVAVVANAGATNTGAIDDLAGISAACADRNIWLHVDAAYGGAAILAPSHRPQFAGIERADSITIDPHKWLFTPYDCAAILYRDPEIARSTHRQRAEYLDAVDESEENPADYAVHLTRRARGVPVWASLVANGTDAYVDAVECCLAMADYAAKQIDASSCLELAAPPQLSVVLFRRAGWDRGHYDAWSARMRREGLALVTPTMFDHEPALRLCFVNPLTTMHDVDVVLTNLERDAPVN